MTTQPTSDQLTVPTWVYVIVVLLGPAVLMAVVVAGYVAICLFAGLLAKFDHWLMVAIVIGYMIMGAMLAALISSVTRK
jgi:hypothetical protein